MVEKKTPLSKIKGMGEKKIAEMEKAGVASAEDLVKADPKKLAEKVSGSEEAMGKFQEKAGEIVKKEGEKDGKGEKGKSEGKKGDKKEKEKDIKEEVDSEDNGGEKSGEKVKGEKGGESKEEEKKDSGEVKEKGKEKGEKKKEVSHPRKNKAVVNGRNLKISTKHSIAICKYIKGKNIEEAIEDLGKVIKKREAIPMRGKIGHKKGMESGRYPVNASKEIVRLLNQLISNSDVNGIGIPYIYSASANKASRPYRRFGSEKMKRSHVHIESKERGKE